MDESCRPPTTPSQSPMRSPRFAALPIKVETEQYQGPKPPVNITQRTAADSNWMESIAHKDVVP